MGFFYCNNFYDIPLPSFIAIVLTAKGFRKGNTPAMIDYIFVFWNKSRNAQIL